jgi:CRISPR-associated protein Csm3
MTNQIKLYGRVFIESKIRAVTGLHIGGSGGSFSIGGNDNPVIVNPISGEPYIPGSSLRGKMRSLTEKYTGAQMVRHANVQMHTATNQDEYDNSPIAQIYGVSAEKFNLPTRLIVRDIPLTRDSRDELLRAKTDLPFTEVKTEVSIDRITSQANPRPIERVPAGAIFGPMEMVYSIYAPQDISNFALIIDGMSLLEDDYLGGSGSRGSGKVSFENISISLKQSNDYRSRVQIDAFETLGDLIAAVKDVEAFIEQISVTGA